MAAGGNQGRGEKLVFDLAIANFSSEHGVLFVVI